MNEAANRVIEFLLGRRGPGARSRQAGAVAVCQNVLAAAIALGYGAQWVMEWWAYDRDAAKVLGLTGEEKIAGFIHIGSRDKPLEDRPRPAMDDIVAEWTGKR